MSSEYTQPCISAARADKGHTGSFQSAPGSVLIKERVEAPARIQDWAKKGRMRSTDKGSEVEV